jgi:hypothetical protein
MGPQASLGSASGISQSGQVEPSEAVPPPGDPGVGLVEPVVPGPGGVGVAGLSGTRQHSAEALALLRTCKLNPAEIDPDSVVLLDARSSPYWSYLVGVRMSIQAAFNGVGFAQTQGLTGHVELLLRVDHRGRLKEVWVSRGLDARRRVLTQIAVQTANKAAPFQPFPAEYSVEQLFLQVRFEFSGVAGRQRMGGE